jgi:TP53 regulating kinase and related kinases
MRCMRAGVSVPAVYFVDDRASRIVYEAVTGRSVREFLQDKAVGSDERVGVVAGLGTAIARMHEAGLVHGDLTTSNAMVRDAGAGPSAGRVVLIDFGLSYVSELTEDRAVDLYVLVRAFASTHPESEGLVEVLTEAYLRGWKGGAAVMVVLEKVKLRGRKRSMVG